MQSPTKSLWQATAEVPDFPPLDASTEADVCVIGAGIAGLSSAYMLAKAGKRVLVLDDGPIGGGETGRTTAHLAFAMDDRFHVLEKIHGEEGMRRIVESHAAAVNRIEQIVQLENIDCDFRRVDGYLFLGPDDDRSTLDDELAAAKRAGLVDVECVPRAPIADWESGPALRFPNQGQFHPLRYLAGLARAFTEAGGRICCGTHVTDVMGGNPCIVQTKDGHTVTAGAVCVCTNGAISDKVRTHAMQAPYRTYVVAFAIPRAAVPTLFWDTEDPYHYVRWQRIDPDAAPTKGEILHDALIVGGEDHKTAHDDDAPERWAKLEEWTRARWPAAQSVLYRWSGQVLEPSDGAAFIGRNPDGAANVYIATGDSGQGMTHGTIAGILLTDLIMGRDNPWAGVYDPSRVSLRPSSLKEAAKENIDVAIQFAKDRLTPSPSEDEILPGHGAVIRRGKNRVAAYRDESGTMHYRSAVCTHLGCIVDWNSAERSWDCPCHGSRFNPHGEVLNGPATEALREADSAQPSRPRRIRRSRAT